jgi:hypothetical protein
MGDPITWDWWLASFGWDDKPRSSMCSHAEHQACFMKILQSLFHMSQYHGHKQKPECRAYPLWSIPAIELHFGAWTGKRRRELEVGLSFSMVNFLPRLDQQFTKTCYNCLFQGSKNTLIYTLDTKVHETELRSGQVHGFFPQCCVVISKHPYFYAMKEILSW